MPKKKTRTQTKDRELGLEEQVSEITMADKVNAGELSELIRTIIREEINVVVDKLQPQLDVIKKDVAEWAKRADVMEESLNSMDTRITQLEEKNESLSKENADLKEKVDRLENHSRKYNIRILGVNGDAEKGNPTMYASELLKELVGEKLQCSPEVELAHRVGPVDKAGQRAMMVKLRSLITREEILKMARTERVFVARGMKLRIFPDFSTETAKARASFREVRNSLRSAGVKHGIIHPATLILTFKGESRRFNDHHKAELYFKSVIEPEVKNRDG